MKKVFGLCVGLVAILALGSCNKCIECTYQLSGGPVSGSNCGSASENDEYESAWMTAASTVGGTDAECHKQ